MVYLLTVQGKDQKGLVEALASAVEREGGNWLESRLCRLGGLFAGIVQVSFNKPPGTLPEKVESLSCQWQAVDESPGAAQPASRARLSFLAADRPGLVKQISHVLSSNGANVEEIESHVRSAPFSGEQMFEAKYLITLDGDCDRAAINSGLDALAEELMCDLDFEEEL